VQELRQSKRKANGREKGRGAEKGEIGLEDQEKLGKESQVKLWLDDNRPCPLAADGEEGWTLAKTSREAIELLKIHDFEEASLDHDLGHCDACNQCGGYTSSACGHDCHWTGYTVVIFMINSGRWPKTKPRVHSANPIGAGHMKDAIDRYYMTNEKIATSVKF